MPKQVDITGQQFAEWTVIEYIGDRLWRCRCSCGNIMDISGYNLRYGKSKSCGHETFKDIIGQQFGEWTVLEYSYSDKGNSVWKCECSCGEIREVHGNRLKSGRSKSCGHATNGFKDLTGEQFGELTVLNYCGDSMWECECSCGTVKSIAGSSLKRGMSKSCGCIQTKLRKNTLLDKYGDTIATKNREKWQIDTLESREKFIAHIEKRGYEPTAGELAGELGVNTANIYKRIHQYNLEILVKINYNSSAQEDELYGIIESSGLEIIRRDRQILGNRELDIHIPSKKIALEFNGNYWHSTIFKEKNYHQDKTIDCAKRGLRLIHIFEYEWEDEDCKVKLVNMLKSILDNKSVEVIYGRKVSIKEINNSEAKIFINKYHLQNHINAEICLGCYSGYDLIGVMTFGKPRFNTDCQYELLRLCWKTNVRVLGGAEKLFKYFIVNYNAESIITYTDISKFTGGVYVRLGFKASVSDITEPNYKWLNITSKEVLSRYQTMKHKLINNGLSEYGNTENEIMENLGFIKIYDSGNLRSIWRNTNVS